MVRQEAGEGGKKAGEEGRMGEGGKGRMRGVRDVEEARLVDRGWDGIKDGRSGEGRNERLENEGGWARGKRAKKKSGGKKKEKKKRIQSREEHIKRNPRN